MTSSPGHKQSKRNVRLYLTSYCSSNKFSSIKVALGIAHKTIHGVSYEISFKHNEKDKTTVSNSSEQQQHKERSSLLYPDHYHVVVHCYLPASFKKLWQFQQKTLVQKTTNCNGSLGSKSILNQCYLNWNRTTLTLWRYSPFKLIIPM